MNLKTKILLGYSIPLVLLILVGVWGVFNLLRLGKASDAILQENYRSILAAENMIDSLERQDSATLLVLLNNETEGVQQFRDNEIDFLQWLGRAKDNITIDGEAQTLETLESHYRDYLATFGQMSGLNAPDQPTPNYYYQTLLPRFQRVRQASGELRDLNQKTMVAASKQAQRISEQATWSMIGTGVVAAGLGIGASLLLSDRIVQPLRKMTRATEQIADGKYDVVLDVETQDELGHLAQEITTMSRKLKAFHKLNVGKVIAEKQRNEAIISSIADGLVVVDDQFKIIAVNPTAAVILGTTPEQAQHRAFQEVVRSELLYGYMQDTAKSGQPPALEEAQSTLDLERDGKTQYYKFAITPVTTEGNRRLGVVLLLQDVTKLKELDQLKSEFVATASHELRTPLTGMSMSINLLLENAQQKLSESEQELLQTARDDIQRLRALVNDLLDLSKIESGRIEMDLVPVDVGLLIEKALSPFKVQAEEQKVELVRQIPEDLPQAKADANKITWVLTNLVANALRYTDAGGQIRVAAHPHQNSIEVSVADDGDGIPFEYQARIFDKFVQVETERDVGGSGLGLAICKEMIKAHGGTIWVDSAPGQGSTFRFTLRTIHSSSLKKGDVAYAQ